LFWIGNHANSVNIDMKIVEIIRAQALPSPWLYHATSLWAAFSIAKGGLRTGTSRRSTYGEFEAHARGKTFFSTTPETALGWHQSVHGELQGPNFLASNGDEDDDTPRNMWSPYREYQWTTIMLRLPARDVETDPFDDQEKPGSVYSTTKVISPRRIQFWHPERGWLPLTVENLDTVEPDTYQGHAPPLQDFDS
jgi:hypothetical protein